MLSNAQKHELIVKFNEERDIIYGEYEREKGERKERESKSGTAKAKNTSEYNKLYK